VLYASFGNNGVLGGVAAYDVKSGVSWVPYPGLKYCQAIEGIYLDKSGGKLYVMNDGGYHTVAQPALNAGITYRIKP
jgi:hypothetical protein